MLRERSEYQKKYYQRNRDKLIKQNQENYDKKRKCFAVKVGNNYYCYKQKKDIEVMVLKYSDIEKQDNFIPMF